MLYSLVVLVGCLVYWSSKAKDLAGYPKKEVKNRHMWEVMNSSPLILPMTFLALSATGLSALLFFYHLLYVIGGATTT